MLPSFFQLLLLLIAQVWFEYNFPTLLPLERFIIKNLVNIFVTLSEAVDLGSESCAKVCGRFIVAKSLPTKPRCK